MQKGIIFILLFYTLYSFASLGINTDKIQPSFEYPNLDTTIVAHAKLYQAQLYITRAMPDMGISLLLELINEAEKNSDFAVFCNLYLVEGYRLKFEFQKGKKLLRELLLTPGLSIRNKSIIYNRLAALYQAQRDEAGINRYDSIVKYSFLSLEISKKYDYSDLMASTQNELGYYYHHTEKKDTLALEYFHKALERFLTLKSYQNAYYVSLNISSVYRTLDKYDEALNVLLKVENTLDPSNNKRLFRLFYEKKALVLYKMKRFEEAYYFMEKAYASDNEFCDNKTAYQIRELIAKYDLALKEQKIQQEKQKNMYLFIVFAILILTAIMILINVLLKKKLMRSENQKLKIELESKNRELVNAIGNMIGINKVYRDIKISLQKNDPKKTISIINKNIRTDQNWQRFNHNFEKIHPNFYHIMQEKFPELSKTDYQLAALLLMKLSSQEIAVVLNINKTSVSKKRNRLRSKLNIPEGTDLYLYITEACNIKHC